MSKSNEYRLAVILLVIILTVAILFGGYSLYTVYGIEKPVEKSLASIHSVSTVQVEKEKDQYTVQVKLGPVDNLQTAYAGMEKAAAHRLAKDSYQFKIVDYRNRRLNDLYGHLQLAVQQAIAKNEFVWLDSLLAQETSELGMQYRLMVDDQHLYVQIQDKNHYLYEIVKRPEPTSNLTPGVQ